MAAARFYATLNIIFRGHIFNWFWRPKEKRRAVRYKVISDVYVVFLAKRVCTSRFCPLRLTLPIYRK